MALVTTVTPAEAQVIAYYALARVGYSLFERRSPKCVMLEILFASGFALASVVFLHYWRSVGVASLVLLAYLLTAILPYWIIKMPPVETAFSHWDKTSQGRPPVWFGIIDAVWLAIMGATCAAIIGGYLLGIIGGALPPPGRSAEYYRATLEEAWFFLGFATNGLFALGATLGGCMAILWAGELWRKHDNVSITQYRDHTIASAKMVMAFFVVAVGTIGWASVPLYTRIVGLRELILSAK